MFAFKPSKNMAATARTECDRLCRNSVNRRSRNERYVDTKRLPDDLTHQVTVQYHTVNVYAKNAIENVARNTHAVAERACCDRKMRN